MTDEGQTWGWNDNPVRVVGALEVFIGALGVTAITVGADAEVTAAGMGLASAAVGLVTAFVVRMKVTPYLPEAAVNPESMRDCRP
jgi:hypothetical protein